MKSEGETKGLNMNVKKTKTMTIAKENNIKGTIKVRIALVKNTFHQMVKVFNSREINLTLNLRLISCYDHSVLIYGCET